MQVLSATGGIAATNCFVIADEASGRCVLIDAPDHTVASLIDEIDARGWSLAALWLTHGHFDHVADHKIIRDRFPGVQVIMHALDAPKLRDPRVRGWRLPFEIPPGEPTGLIADGDVGEIGALRARAMHTPGHSPGHVCFYFEADKLLVGGDLIIGGAIGRTDFPDCSVTDMQASIRKVMALPDDVRLLGGHGGPTTIGDERRNNPYVRMALEGRLAELG